MPAKDHGLRVPPGAETDPQAQELIRAWVAHGGLHCSLNVGAWSKDEAICWGVLLSDVARHVADALRAQKRIDEQETIEKIRTVFNDELDSPTAEATGGFAE